MITIRKQLDISVEVAFDVDVSSPRIKIIGTKICEPQQRTPQKQKPIPIRQRKPGRRFRGDFDINKHSLRDWVRLQGGIRAKGTSIERELRDAFSRKEGCRYLLLNDRHGIELDILAQELTAEGWQPPEYSDSDLLEDLTRDVQAGDDNTRRLWHPSSDRATDFVYGAA